jgi:hypothetical protein
MKDFLNQITIQEGAENPCLPQDSQIILQLAVRLANVVTNGDLLKLDFFVS